MSSSFQANGMADHRRDEYYNAHYLATIARAGQKISKRSHLVFPVADEVDPIVAAVYYLDDIGSSMGLAGTEVALAAEHLDAASLAKL